MRHKLMHLDNLYDFSLVRYEPNSIILLEKNTRKPFEFFQLANLNNIRPDISHPYLLRPILYKNGVLYPKGSENLSTLLQSRRRDYSPSRYTQGQLFNSFQYIIQCLQYLHSKGISYSNFTAQHIIFFENGQIMLRDWIFRKNQNEQQNEFNKIKQMYQLGIIISSAALLMSEDQLKKLTKSEIISLLLEHYPINLCLAIGILLEGKQSYYNLILKLMANQGTQIQFEQGKQIIKQGIQIKQTRQKQKKQKKHLMKTQDNLLKDVQNEKSKIETPRKQDLKTLNPPVSIQGSPTKKFNISTPNKKIIRLEDCQNKKVFNEEVKKRQIQKITKIIERSNAFVNELMARKNQDRKFLNSAKINSSMIEVQQNTKKTTFLKESPKLGSPSKRLRSISKKK